MADLVSLKLMNSINVGTLFMLTISMNQSSFSKTYINPSEAKIVITVFSHAHTFAAFSHNNQNVSLHVIKDKIGIKFTQNFLITLLSALVMYIMFPLVINIS